MLAERSAAIAAEALTKSSTSEEPFPPAASSLVAMTSGRSLGVKYRFSSEMELAKLSMLHKKERKVSA